MRCLILQSDPLWFACFMPQGISLTFYHGFFLLVFDVYRGIANKDITDSIQSEMSGDLEDALLAVGECPAFKLCLQSNYIIRDVASCFDCFT